MSKDLVVKTNRLNQAFQVLSLAELHIIQLAIVDARETGTGLSSDTPLRINALRYTEVFKTTKQNAYQRMKEAEDTLFNRRFSFYDEDGKLVKSRWISQVKYFDNEGAIEIAFTPAVVQGISRIYGVEEFFTQYLLSQTANLNSVYAARIYELLIQWRKTGITPIFKLSDFREQLGLGSNEYKAMSDFKKRVLDLAVTQINTHTDITVSYEQHKARRTITGFSFTFKSKKAPEPKAKPEKASKTRLEPLMPTSQDKLAAEFTALPVEQQETVIHHVKSKLKGVKLVQFNAALSAYRSTQSKALFHEYEAIFSQALEAFTSAKT